MIGGFITCHYIRKKFTVDFDIVCNAAVRDSDI